MCDLVNSDFYRHGKDTVKALKLKVTKRAKPVKQMLALVALEMCMKNCGAQFHAMVVQKELLFECARLLRGGSCDPDVRAKVAVLVQEWGTQLLARRSTARRSTTYARAAFDSPLRTPPRDPTARTPRPCTTRDRPPPRRSARTSTGWTPRTPPPFAPRWRRRRAEVEAEERARRACGEGSPSVPATATPARQPPRPEGALFIATTVCP